jgi:hypothetical protein
MSDPDPMRTRADLSVAHTDVETSLIIWRAAALKALAATTMRPNNSRGLHHVAYLIRTNNKSCSKCDFLGNGSRAFVPSNRDPTFRQILMPCCGVNRVGVEGQMYTESPPLNGDYPRHDVDGFERASSNRVHRLRPGAVPRASSFSNTKVASGRPPVSRRVIRTLGRFSAAVAIGVGATLAWQTYGGEMLRIWAPSLGWLSPTSPSAELQGLVKPIAFDIGIMKRSVEQLASNQDQLGRRQDQLTQAFATLQAAVRDINQNILALAPLAPKAGHASPKTAQSPAQ